MTGASPGRTPHTPTDLQVDFAPSAAPPVGRVEPALFFAFRGDDLLVTQPEAGQAAVPRLVHFGELGVEATSLHYLGRSWRHGHCYAVELPEGGLPPAGMGFCGLRQLYGRLEEEVLWLGGRAVQVVRWHCGHRYCGRCGSPTQAHADPRERARVCPQCQAQYFPRLSPAVIVLVQRGERFLLARNHRFPPRRYSIIAGFVEPGETLEQAVVREVGEEVGIRVTNVRYFGSQPWPFPNSLMIGFTAEWAGGEIRLAEEEIADAGWYTRDPAQLPELPDGLSISRRLIDWFVAQGSRR
ncbi:MAG: NAD(+) diphosphatase [Candidatus Latescibacterota bacterium]